MYEPRLAWDRDMVKPRSAVALVSSVVAGLLIWGVVALIAFT